MDSEDELLCALALVVVKQSVGKKRSKRKHKIVCSRNISRESQVWCSKTCSHNENYKQRNLFQVSLCQHFFIVQTLSGNVKTEFTKVIRHVFIASPERLEHL